MMDPRDEARLNDWIEGEPGVADDAAVEAMLAADPALAARVRAMRADRERLRSLPAPAVPADLRAAIDDRVERMLLLGLAAGEQEVGRPVAIDAEAPVLALAGGDTAGWRARREKRRRRRLVAGAAGGLAVAASAALLVLLAPGPGREGGGPPADRLADGASEAATGAGSGPSFAESIAEPFAPDRRAVVVHGLPLPSVAPPAERLAAADGPGAEAPSDPDGPVPAVRLAGLDAAELERRLAAALGEDATLTRNLTTEAVARLMPRGRTPAAEPLWADLDAARHGRAEQDWRRRLDERLAGALRSGRATTDGAATPGRVVVGDPDGRPGWGEQIVFAESGAGWTVSVPARRAAEMLAAIDAIAPGGSRLLAIDPVRWSTAEGAEAWRDARSELRRLAREAPERLVHIPVVLAD